MSLVKEQLRAMDFSSQMVLKLYVQHLAVPFTARQKTRPDGRVYTHPAAGTRPPRSPPLPRSVRRNNTSYFVLRCACLPLQLSPESCTRGQGLVSGRSKGHSSTMGSFTVAAEEPCGRWKNKAQLPALP